MKWHDFTRILDLPLEERDEFIRASFNADLPPISFPIEREHRVTSIPFEEGDFNSMTNNQLLWSAEIVRSDSFRSYDKMTSLYTVLHEKNLPMHGSARSSHAMTCNSTISPNTRKAYFASNPLGYFINSGKLNNLFTDEEKPDPTQYDLNEIRALSYNELSSYADAFNHSNREHSHIFAHSLPPEIRVVFLGALHAHGLSVDDDVGEHNALITQRIIDIIKEDDNAFEWFYAKYSRIPYMYNNMMDAPLREQLNDHIRIKGKAAI